MSSRSALTNIFWFRYELFGPSFTNEEVKRSVRHCLARQGASSKPSASQAHSSFPDLHSLPGWLLQFGSFNGLNAVYWQFSTCNLLSTVWGTEDASSRAFSSRVSNGSEKCLHYSTNDLITNVLCAIRRKDKVLVVWVMWSAGGGAGGNCSSHWELKDHWMQGVVKAVSSAWSSDQVFV